jgi:hypothetical protein
VLSHSVCVCVCDSCDASTGANIRHVWLSHRAANSIQVWYIHIDGAGKAISPVYADVCAAIYSYAKKLRLNRCYSYRRTQSTAASVCVHVYTAADAGAGCIRQCDHDHRALLCSCRRCTSSLARALLWYMLASTNKTVLKPLLTVDETS